MKRFLFLAFLTANITVMCFSYSQSKKARPKQKNKSEIAAIKEYRKFFRVNEKPIDMIEATKFLCGRTMGYDPHYSPGVVYYINDRFRQGLQEFSTQKQFPVGAIVVKEKQEKRTDDSVKIITVMQKIKAGHEETSWDYKLYDVTKWEELDFPQPAPHSLGVTSCLSCHKAYKHNDYISQRGMALMLANKGKGNSK